MVKDNFIWTCVILLNMVFDIQSKNHKTSKKVGKYYQ